MLQSFNNFYRKDNVSNITLKLGKAQNWQSSEDMTNEILIFDFLRKLSFKCCKVSIIFIVKTLLQA